MVYAGTHCGNMEAGALIMIPSALIRKRAKQSAIKAALDEFRNWWPGVDVRVVDRPRAQKER